MAFLRSDGKGLRVYQVLWAKYKMGSEVEGRRVRNAKKCAMGPGHMGRLL